MASASESDVPVEKVPIVGIGASAGGVDALKKFLSNLPPEPGYATVIIQHTSSDSDESRPELFGRMTDLPVNTIQDNTSIKPNQVHLNPGDAYVNVEGKVFKTREISTEKPLTLPIDHFFESLADSRKHSSAGVVLSGTGTDGTLGLKKIKYRGGITVVQDPKSAQYPNMPQHASQTVNVDFVLEPGKIPEKIATFKDHPYVSKPDVLEEKSDFSEDVIDDILAMIYEKTGHDLRGYKYKPIKRRLSRELAIHQFTNLKDYRDYLQPHPEKLEGLFQNLLIDYTRFFRDRKAFEALKTDILPTFLEDQPTDRPLRVWVPGCSTGEEVYSLVILLNKAMSRIDKHLQLKVFGTDIVPSVLEVAREGFYPSRIAEHLKKNELEKYFIRKNGGYEVKPTIRDGVIFAEHNMLQDPPYSNIDLLSCRNLFIYLDENSQNQAMDILHYSLRVDGLLFLGPTETSGHPDLFEDLDQTNKIYRKKAHSEDLHHPILDLTESTYTDRDETPEPDSASPRIVHQAEQKLLHNYGPPAVLLEETHEVLHFFGNTERWLKHPQGEVNYNILELIEEPFKQDLIELLDEVSPDNRTVSTQKLFETEDEIEAVKIRLESLRQTRTGPLYYLLIFQTVSPDHEIEKDRTEQITEAADQKDISKDKLKEELESTKSYLHKTIERLEKKNKQLQAKNRELQSLNEEYQSTNEELETSKEELQSTNEELMTVNQKLEEKVKSLDELNQDMNNLLRATDIPIIFLDRELNIKRFTPASQQIFNLIDSDEGRPLSDITSNLTEDNEYIAHARKVLKTLEKREFEAETEDGDRYLVQIIPYRTDEDAIEGVVVTLFKTTKLRSAQEDVRVLGEVLKDSNDAIILADSSGTITQWNRGAEHLYGYTEEEATGKNILEFVAEDNKNNFQKKIDEVTSSGKHQSFRCRKIVKDESELEVWVTLSTVDAKSIDRTLILLTERNLDWLPDSDE